MKPLVTLAVPTLNRPGYLRETLGAVLAQDYANLEILVSDNGSRDETPSLAQTIIKDDPRARFRRNDSTVPIHEHFNQCINAARGEFFILLSDDDRINPTFVSELVDVATRDASINVVVPAHATIDEKGEIIEERPKPDGEIFDGPEFVCNWLHRRTPPPFACLVTLLARTAVIREFGGFQDFARGQNIDNCLFLQLAIRGRVGFAGRAVFNWRVYNRSYGTTSTPQQIAQSSREFVEHLRNDDRSRAALDALPGAISREVIDGVRLMTAEEFLFRIKFYEAPLRWKCLRDLFIFRLDGVFLRTVFREYYHRLRGVFRRPAAPHSATA